MAAQEANSPTFEQPIDLLAFWFGDEYRNKRELQSTTYITQRMALWFGRESVVFEDVQHDNASLLSKNAEKEPALHFLSPWRNDKSNEACLARVILYDQFPRTIFRGTAQAFAWEQACHLNIKQIIENGKAEGLDDTDANILSHSFTFCPIERFFIGVALQHSEDFRFQTLGYDVGRALINEAKVRVAAGPADFALTTELCNYFKDLKGYPQDVYDVIVKFGRFPTRNEVLGRHSSKRETEWLEGDSKPLFLRSVKRRPHVGGSAAISGASSAANSIAPSRSSSPSGARRIPYGEMVQQLWAEGQAAKAVRK